jgi:hypothetical protein
MTLVFSACFIFSAHNKRHSERRNSLPAVAGGIPPRQVQVISQDVSTLLDMT